MKHFINTFLLLVAITGLSFLFSCKKDKANNPSSQTRELLMTGAWKLTGYSIDPALDADGDGDTETNLFKSWPDCRKDDFYTFINNSTVEVNAGATKCNPGDAQIVKWAYDLSADEKRMMYDGSEYSIEELNNTTLRLLRKTYYTSTDKIHAVELVYQH